MLWFFAQARRWRHALFWERVYEKSKNNNSSVRIWGTRILKKRFRSCWGGGRSTFCTSYVATEDWAADVWRAARFNIPFLAIHLPTCQTKQLLEIDARRTAPQKRNAPQKTCQDSLHTTHHHNMLPRHHHSASSRSNLLLYLKKILFW